MSPVKMNGKNKIVILCHNKVNFYKMYPVKRISSHQGQQYVGFVVTI